MNFVCLRLIGASLFLLLFGIGDLVAGQVRGVYPLGMSATNSRVTPSAPFTYSNQLLIYSRDKFKGPNGEKAVAHYKVNALGFASNFSLPKKANVGFKYFKEFANRSTFQGYSVQFSGSISF